MSDETHKDPTFDLGQLVKRTGGDYEFVGMVVARFTKISGAVRYVVENNDRILHIFSARNLVAIESIDDA